MRQFEKTISTWPPQWVLSEWVTKGSSRDASASKNMISLRTFPLSANASQSAFGHLFSTTCPLIPWCVLVTSPGSLSVFSSGSVFSLSCCAMLSDSVWLCFNSVWLCQKKAPRVKVDNYKVVRQTTTVKAIYHIYRQVGTWIHENNIDLTSKGDPEQHSQFFRCLYNLMFHKSSHYPTVPYPWQLCYIFQIF